MTEREKLEDQLRQLQELINVATPTFKSSVEDLTQVLGTHDAPRINAAKDALQLSTEMMRSLTDEQKAVQRRLEYLTTEELTRRAIEVTRSSAKATWATFWVAMFAMVVTTTATIIVAILTRS